MKRLFAVFGILVFALTAQAQVPHLTIGSAIGKPGSTVHLPVTLEGVIKEQIVGIQWEIAHGPLKIALTLGPAATAASKALMCDTTTTTTCFLVGVNNVLANGIVAFIDVSLPADFLGVTGIEFTKIIGVDSSAKAVSINGVSGTISDSLTSLRRPIPPRPPSMDMGEFTGKNRIVCKRETSNRPAALRMVGDQLHCTCQIPMEEKGGWYYPFTTGDNLMDATPKSVFVESGQLSFEFEVTLIADPQVTGESILFVGAGKNGEKTIFGVIRLMPPAPEEKEVR